MVEIDSEWQSVFDSPIDGRDNNILKLIEEEDLTVFTFEGLKED